MSVSTTVPEKRRPGRPKGSGKKYPDGAPPKIKRPVGRPRKDGFPAGSVTTSRSRKSNTTVDGNGLALGFFGHQDIKPIFNTLQGANFDGEDWLEMSRTKPGNFINTLITLLASPNPVSPAGTVEDAFKTHVNSLVTPANQTLPSLYSVLRTFWLPTSPTYFCLTASNATRPILEFRFLYWDPQPLVFNGIACPSCSAPLANRGRIASGPVKIYDLEQPFFIIGCEYVCQSAACIAATSPDGRRYASTDPSILRSLPNTLADELPARLRQFDADLGSGPDVWNWQPIGVSKALWNMVQGSLRSGVRKEVILQIVVSIQHGIPEPPPAIATEREEQREEEQHDELMANDDPVPPIATMPQPQQDGDEYKGYTDSWKVHQTSSEPETPASATQSTGPSTSQPTYIYAPPPPPPQSQFTHTLRYPPYFTAPSTKVGSSSSAGAIPNTVASPSNQMPPPPNNQMPQPPPSNQMPPPPNSESPNQHSPVDIHSNKRAYPFTLEAVSGPSGNSTMAEHNHVPQAGPVLSGNGEGPRKRSPRHCSKCGSADCKGKGGRSFCSNACRDCGKLDCMGRTNRRNVCQNRTWA
ncbi:hypothetical protein BDZ89DRAFT_1102165 [Hymenopellis radicata]|nr:hypothetical protein BDZ89DRAFT_1102165 [Hymenopellis radicata]